jgi:hypothetical protein
MLGAFGGLVAGEEEKHNEPIAQSNLSMDINSAVEAIKGKDVKKAAEHMASIAVELKRVGGALDDKTLSDIEKLAAVVLNGDADELNAPFMTMCVSAGGKVKGCMLNVLRKQALDGSVNPALRRSFIAHTLRDDGTLLLAELEVISRYRMELASMLTQHAAPALQKMDTDVLYSIVRDAIIRSERMVARWKMVDTHALDSDELDRVEGEAIFHKVWENTGLACSGLRELAERNADGVLMLIVEAEKSEMFNVPKGGGKRVYMLKEAAKTARFRLDMHASKRPEEFVRDRLSAMLANKDAWDESIADQLIRMADRMKQTNAIPQLRELVHKKLMPKESDWIKGVIWNIEKAPK